jgi:hypothetical protein
MKGQKRSLIPLAFADLAAWRAPDLAQLGETQKKYVKRKTAVEMYSRGSPYEEIQRVTSCSESEVRRLVRRCVTPDGAGGIHGFFALISGKRIEQYHRVAPVDFSIPGRKPGYSGVLIALLGRFPELLEYIVNQMTKGGDEIHEARISYRDLHEKVITWLKGRINKEGDFKSDEWPLNATYRGYETFRKLFIQLREDDSGSMMSARSGEEAARRVGLGQGHETLLAVLRPFSFVQLDFHKVDAAAIIIVHNPHGEEIEVPLARWHIGLLADEYSAAVLGAYISIESNPSGDCVLETVECAIRPGDFKDGDPRIARVKDGKIFIHQMLPEYQYQCFAALKVDNAWCNSSTTVVNNIIDTVGCAINFGPVRRWWRRALIERIFKQLTNRGLQRLRSSYGTGPADTRRNAPEATAIKFRIMLDELISIIFGCIREYNEECSTGRFGSSPVTVLKKALETPELGVLPQKLPRCTQSDLRLMMHVEESTVRGNIDENVAPYFKVDQCRYTNDSLSKRFDLVGKTIVAYVDRRTCQVQGTVKETAEDLGVMIPEKKWRRLQLPWRIHKIINRWANAKRYQKDSVNVVSDWVEEKTEAEQSRRRKKGKVKGGTHNAKPSTSVFPIVRAAAAYDKNYDERPTAPGKTAGNEEEGASDDIRETKTVDFALPGLDLSWMQKLNFCDLEADE